MASLLRRLGDRHHPLSPLYRKLGGIFQLRGVTSLASVCYREAMRLSPADARSAFELGKMLLVKGNAEAAAGFFRNALSVRPNYPEAHNNLGVALQEQALYEEASECFRAALRLKPDYAVAHNNLGNAYLNQQHPVEAEACYRRALRANGNYTEAFCNLGVALNQQGRYREAEGACREALRLQPGFAGALSNLGKALQNQGELDEAESSYLEALRLKPDLGEASVNLAIMQGDINRLAGAVNYYEKAIARNSDSVESHNMLGLALQAQGRFEDAAAQFQAALRLRPAASAVHANLGNNYIIQARLAEALACYRRAMVQPSAEAISSYVFHLHYCPDHGPDEIFAEHVRWGRLYTGALPRVTPHHDNAPDPRRKLRVGYVSRDFFQHSVAFFIEPVIRHHDRVRVEVFCYANVIKPDQVTERLKVAADGWRDIHLKSDEQVCKLISEDRIDILVDLSGHTSGWRPGVFARKPAPVQVTYLGYPDTSGLDTIDYRITDEHADPPGRTECYHTEELVRLPGCFVVYNPPADAPGVALPPVLAKGHVTFGCFNNVVKVNRRVVALWSKILHSIPGSRLALKGIAFSSAATRKLYLEMFEEHCIAAERIDLWDFVPTVSGHLELYREIDIALDPFPYNGTTTTCEALWMGVPVICLAGKTHASRVGVSLLSNAGLDSFISGDEAAYMEKAVALARDVEQLRQWRFSLRDRLRNSSLTDAVGFTRALEDAYREMWRRWCAEGPKTRSESRTGPRDEMEIAIAGGVRLTVPASIRLMTSYILLEQEDWFEDEIKFVRRIVKPGMKAIDIGANYGTYALSLAQAVGAGGLVWAFEPAGKTMAFLEKSVVGNRLDNIRLVRAGLSNHDGRGSLNLSGEAETHTLGSAGGSSWETIALRTLDSCADEYQWRGIDFVKIDAEGEELNILRGAKSFLAGESPLVMFEFKHGGDINTGLIEEFGKIGYRIYRLIPGLQLLCPFNQGDPVDPYLLNLFACKPERAAKLAADGVLAEESVEATPTDTGEMLWKTLAGSMPYGRKFSAFWEARAEQRRPDWLRYLAALNLYALSCSGTLSAMSRAAALKQSVSALMELTEAAPTLPRLMTLCRAATEYGLRGVAAGAVNSLAKAVAHSAELAAQIDEPFLPVSRRYDEIDPGTRMFDWVKDGILEQQELSGWYSSYFAGVQSLPVLESLRDSPFQSAEMERRRQLVRMRFGLQDGPEKSALLGNSLNREFWG